MLSTHPSHPFAFLLPRQIAVGDNAMHNQNPCGRGNILAGSHTACDVDNAEEQIPVGNTEEAAAEKENPQLDK